MLQSYSFCGYSPHRDLHSFPTRRSSDLGEEHVLQHVDAEEVDREYLERGYERGEERRDSEEEDARAPRRPAPPLHPPHAARVDRKSTRLNSSHGSISYAVFCLKKKKKHT